jgi:NitT/TauT family transport system substrate-binding protein
VTVLRRDFVRLAAGAPLAGFGLGTTARAQNLQTLRVLSFASDAIKQVLYPMQAGIFSKLGFQVQLDPMGSGAAIISALVGGSGDFGSGSLFPLFSAFGHGIPLRIVAPIALYDTDHCDSWLVVRADSDIHEAHDLNGKVMGGDTPGEISVVATRIWMDRHSGDGKSLRALALNVSELLPALLQGRIDTAVLRPPFLTVAMQSGRVRVLGKPLDVVAPRFLLSAWVASADYIDKNPAAVKAWVAALSAGARYVDGHQDATVDMVAQFTKQDPAQIRAGVRTIIAESVTLADVQAPLDFAYKYGVIDKQYDARGMLSEYLPLKGRNA